MLNVFTAKSIITMNPSLPRAEAVAVRDGRIIEVGTLDSMGPLLDNEPWQRLDDFANDIIVPGLIDPHLHPAMAAVLLPMEFITALEWRFPWGNVPASETPDAYDVQLSAIAKEFDQDLLITWGHHELWHGPMSRQRINDIDKGANEDLAIVVWDRSFHELCMNDAALAKLGIDEESIGARQQIDLERGRFFEVGLGYAIQKLNPILLAPERFRFGMQRLRDAVHFGGQTTIGDMALGIFHFDTELSTIRDILDTEQTPFRTELVVDGLIKVDGKDINDAVSTVEALQEQNTHRLRFGRRIKLFADGAFFSGLAQLQEPGYLDGHHGEWLMPPPKLEAAVRTYWHANFQIHVHVTGDLGLELVLDILEKMQQEKPRFNHGFTLEHFGLSTPEQVQRAAALGARVSANVYYLHELSAIFAKRWVGHERASQMARVGSAFAAGITTTLHSDFTMAPAAPLNSMWVAVNRQNCEGDIMGPAERISAEQALQAVTINAARVLGIDSEVGSIRSGKLADFTVLAEDPLTIDPMGIRDIQIRATVFEGKPYPVAH